MSFTKRVLIPVVAILSALLCQAAYQPFDQNTFESIKHIPKFGGEVWYVSSSGSDSNDGKVPDTAFLTIGKAITEAAAGDIIHIRAGTYTETGINVNKDGLELHFEIGAILDPPSGVPLTISGSYCWAGCHDGAVRVSNNSAAVTGVLITGNWVYLEEFRVAAQSVGDIGFDIQGSGCDLRNCRVSDPLTASFKVSGDTNKVEDCCTGGTPANTSIGYWITSTADKARLIRCGSQGHATAPFQIDSGATNTVVWGFSSGGGDGKWTGINDAVISDLTYPETKYATSTFNGGTTYNIFKITGAVRVKNIYGHVTTQIANTSSTIKLILYSTNGTDDITATSGAPNVQNAVVNTCYAKLGPTDEELLTGNPASGPAIVEEISSTDPNNPIILIEGIGADTYIQVLLSAGVASGAIHWHIEWEPITDDGFLEPL